MTVDPSKPAPRGQQAAPRGGTSRLQVAGRLTALIGLPLLVLFLIFSSGVYCGATRSYRVRTIEAKWLGLEPPPGVAGAGEAGEARPPVGEPGPDSAGGEPSGETGAPDEPGVGESGAVGDTKPSEGEPSEPGGEPEPPEPEAPEHEPEPKPPSAGLEVAEAEPVGDPLRERFAEPLVVELKLMVDPTLLVARPEWLAYVANLVETTDQSFQVLFGVEVKLQGVVIWDASLGAEPEALLADLEARDHEGADVVLGLLARSQPEDFEPQRWTGRAHGDHALVFADFEHSDRYYRSMLRTLARLLGAEPVGDAASRELGSFMSGARAEGAPVIDPENRGKVIMNKARPFASSGEAREQAEAPKTEDI